MRPFQVINEILDALPINAIEDFPPAIQCLESIVTYLEHGQEPEFVDNRFSNRMHNILELWRSAKEYDPQDNIALSHTVILNSIKLRVQRLIQMSNQEKQSLVMQRNHASDDAANEVIRQHIQAVIEHYRLHRHRAVQQAQHQSRQTCLEIIQAIGYTALGLIFSQALSRHANSMSTYWLFLILFVFAKLVAWQLRPPETITPTICNRLTANITYVSHEMRTFRPR